MIEFLKLDVIKPFAVLAAILVGLCALEYGFKLEISAIDLNFGGNTASMKKVEGKAVDAGNALVNINDRLAELRKDLDDLRQKTTGVAPVPPPPIDLNGGSGTADSLATDGTRTNDLLARLFKPVRGKVSPLAGKEGYVFIGNRQGDTLNLLPSWIGTGNEPLKSIEALRTGLTYAVLSNLVLRAGQPANDAAYFNGQKSLGVLPTGTAVTLLDIPQPIKRSDTLTQMWAHVRVND